MSIQMMARDRAGASCRRKISVAVALTIAALVASGSVAAQSKGQPVVISEPQGKVPSPFTTWNELYTEQERLNAVADQISAVKSPTGDDGYAGMIVDPANHDVRLYWRGPLPTSVSAAVTAGRKQAPIQVFAAPYSEKELLAEATRWIDSGLATRAGPQPDGKGVSIGVAGPASAGAPRLPSGSAIPIEVEYESILTLAYDRHNDYAPYYGGGNSSVWSNTIGWRGNCSLGFPISDFEGYPGFLTVAHCGQNGTWIDLVYEVDRVSHIGWHYSEWALYETAFISGFVDVGSRIFTGDSIGTNTSRGVAYAKDPYVANYVVNSGARTGEHGSIQVHMKNVQVYNNQSNHVVRGLTLGQQSAHLCATAKGDSGGPVFSYMGGNDSRVIARGIIMGYSGGPAHCWGYNGGMLPSYISGSYTSYFVPIEAALQRTGATLRTSPAP